jgi:hypothetical protein
VAARRNAQPVLRINQASIAEVTLLRLSVANTPQPRNAAATAATTTKTTRSMSLRGLPV